LQGKHVLAVSIGFDLTGAVTDGVADLGAIVGRVGRDLDISSAESIARGIDAAIAQHGAPDLVILNVIPEAALRPAPITEMNESEWRDAAMEGLRTTVNVLPALGKNLKPRGGAIVFVAPSASLVGTPSMIALTTLLEGQRGLMKSVARQWGAIGVTLNWIAAAPRTLAPFEGVSFASKPDTVTVALGRAPDPRSEIAPLLGYLGSDAGPAITGATLVLDGGEWMMP
jgi:NAD(P)-dependent dehydrogenase (short-subunit alcohol dehydrogenase family)